MSSQNFVTDCFFNLTTEERIDLFKRRQGLRLDHVYRTYYGWMALPFGIFGMTISILFILTVYDAIRKRRVSRKCYILLLNRSVGDFLTCLMSLITCAYVFTAREINRDVLSVMEIFLSGSFWSGMVSYVALSLLKLFAVARPFDYRKCVTMKRCVYLIMGSWVVFVLIIAYALALSALVKIPFLNEWSQCKMETCLRFMYRSRNIFTVVVYLITIVVFLLTVVLIKRAQKFVDSFKKGRAGQEGLKSSRFPLWKLALNVSTFAGFYLFYCIWCIFMLTNTDRCFFMRNFTEMMRILGFVRLSIILRICLDPILSFVTDFQIRRGFLSLIGVHRNLTFSSSRGLFGRGGTSSQLAEDNSSEGTSMGSRKDPLRVNPSTRVTTISDGSIMAPKNLTPDRVTISSSVEEPLGSIKRINSETTPRPSILKTSLLKRGNSD